VAHIVGHGRARNAHYGSHFTCSPVRNCWCRVQPCWRHCLSESENDCESKKTRECVIPRRIRRLSHHSKPDVCGPPAPAGRVVRPLVRTVGNRWASRILSIHWQVPDRAGRTNDVAEVWHGLLGLQGTSPQVAVRPPNQRLRESLLTILTE